MKIPLTSRLKAWWEGYDVRDMEAKLREAEERRAKADPKFSKPKPKTEAPEPDAELPILPWDDARVQIAQYIWGEGYCGPGGPEHVIGMSKLLALSPEMSMMVLGAGLGGPGRVLAHEFGVWITGFEASEKLAKAGMELSTMGGMAKKAPVVHYDPEKAEPFSRNYDRAFAKDTLFTVDNKLGLMKQVCAKLKTDGLFLISDFVLANDAVRNTPDYAKWKEQEPHPPHAITPEAEAELFEQSGFSVRVNENISEQYVSLIAKAWADVDSAVTKLMKQGDEGKTMIKALLREAEFWSHRSKMLESGDLQVWRILASKKIPKTMSNW